MNTQGRGLTGDKGDNSYIHIKWHTEGSQTLLDVADDYIGIYVDHTPADSEVYTDYTWFKYKGDPGNLTGPASSVNENIPIFDGVTGDLLKDSGVKLSDKADVDDVAIKADITALETEKKLLMDEIDSLKKSAIENSNAPYLTVSDYGDVALAKNSVGVGTLAVDGVTLTNLITNGGFEEDSPYPYFSPLGWYASIQTIDTTIKYAGSASMKLSINPSGATRGGYGIQTSVLGHVYWFYCRIRVSQNSSYSFRLFDNITTMVATNMINLSTCAVNTWIPFSLCYTAQNDGASVVMAFTNIIPDSWIDDVVVLDLTAHGLDSLTASQVDALVAAGYFDGTKTFSGVGCLVSKDSAEAETGRMYFKTTPMYSNATAKDILTYSGGKYYHTHNVDSDGVAIAEPYDTEVETNGQIICLSEGTVEYQPYFPDIGIYTDKFTLTKAITAVKELYKYGSETLIADAVIAVDGLSFTSASLTAGDLAYGVFEFDEPLRPLMTIKSRNDDATVVDTFTGTVYTFRPVVTNGVVASWALTEV